MRDDYMMNDPARKAVLLARRPLQDKGEIMPQYLVAIHHPDKLRRS